MIVLPYPPTVNTYWRMVVIGGAPRMLISAEGRSYKTRVGGLCAQRGVQPIDGPVRVVIDFYRPRKVGDLDNVLKAPLDALKSFAYHDDKQIVELHARRHDDKDRPRVEVLIEPVR